MLLLCLSASENVKNHCSLSTASTRRNSRKYAGNGSRLGPLKPPGDTRRSSGKVVKGELTDLRIQGCAGCRRKGKTRKPGIDKGVLVAVRDKLNAIRAGNIKLPQRLPSSRTLEAKISIPIWPFPPIVIVVTTDDDTDTVCITIFVGNGFCYVCTSGDVVASTCIPRH